MTAPNRNALWARVLVQELARGGVAHACVAPGNRSGPLAFALAAEPGLRTWSHVDERSMGFFALGLAMATGAPVALACTSGTAAANLLPAVVEAGQARVPLVVLTADRPHDLRDTGANQAIDQVGLFGRQVRWAADLPPPAAEDRALRHLRSLACRALLEARGPPAGPVHLNVPMAKPLEPTPAGDVPQGFAAAHPRAVEGRPGGAPWVAVRASPRPPAPADVAAVAARLEGRRGVIVAGPQRDARLPPALARLAAATGFPLLADPLGGARFGPAAGLGAFDAFLASAAVRAALAPEVVVRAGAAPTSDALLRWMEEDAAELVLLDEAGWREPLHLPGERLAADPALAADALAAAVRRPAPPAWRARWQRAEDAAAAALARGEAFFEGAAARATVEALPEGATLVVSNSLPVRDLDRFAPPRGKALRVLGNRGASGIDGVTSTALGVAAAGQGPVVLLTGDLAFYHDLPGLMAFRRLGVAATLVVLHNDGGRIFEQLPAARFDPPFRDLFVTPHGLDFEHAARLFGARFRRAADLKGYEAALAEALREGGPQVLEARIEPEAAARERRRATEAAARAAEEALARAP